MSELLLEVILTGPEGISPVRYSTPSLPSPTLSLFCPCEYLIRRNEQAQKPLQISVTVPDGYYSLILPNYETTKRDLHVTPIALFQSENINLLIENRSTLNVVLERYDILAELSVMPVVRLKPVIVSFPGETSQPGWMEPLPSPASSYCSSPSSDTGLYNPGNITDILPICLH